MKFDLYSLYKGLYQRSYRNKHDDDFAVMTELAHDLVRNLFRNLYDQAALEKCRIEGIEIAKKIYEMEKNKPGLGRMYSKDIIRALKNNAYEIKIPYPIVPLWQENDYRGSLYVLTRDRYPGQCKLGATYMHVETRVQKYTQRYGYSVNLYFYAGEILNPFSHELEISRKYSHLRKSGNTCGESNEWYYMDPAMLKAEILRILNP